MTAKNEIKNNSALLRILQVFMQYIICAAVITAGLFFVLGLNNADLDKVPLSYNAGDSAPTLLRSYEMFTDKDIFSMNAIGAPDGSQSYDSYALDLSIVLIQYAFALVSPGYIAAYNLFVLSSFYLTGFGALYAFRRLRLSPAVSIGLSVLYTMLPYHFFRYLSHTYLSFYFTVPIACVLAIEIYNGKTLFSQKKQVTRRAAAVNIVLLLLVGMTGIYYAFFSCFFFLVAAVLRAVEDRKFSSVLNGLFSILTTAAGVVISALPSLVFWIKNGLPSDTSSRSYLGGELYSLKISQLVLPVNDHRWSLLSYYKSQYTGFTGINETDTSTLGFVFTVGFVLIILFSFLLTSCRKDSFFKPLLLLTAAALLISTVGSFSTFFGVAFPYIRAYCRICVFIAFFSAAAVGFVADKLYPGKSKAGKVLMGILKTVLVCAVIAGGIWDQTTAQFKVDSYYLAQRYADDESFINSIVSAEETSGTDCSTKVSAYLIPYMRFPENGTVGALVDYAPLLLCVHNSSFSMSYGSPVGRELSDELYQASLLGISDQLSYASDKGYSGILLSKLAFDSETYDRISSELTAALGQPSAESAEYTYWSI